MGDIQTTSGARFYIGGNSVTSEQMDTLAEFEAVTVWTEVGLIEDLGEHGDESTLVTGAAIGDGRIRKAKGARDAGTMTIIAFHDPLDTGQTAMKDAEETNNNYPFKIVMPDAPSAAYQDTIRYFRGMVSSQRTNMGTNDNIMRVTFNVAINSEIFEDPATT